MIEEFEEWLIRQGVDPDLASDMHDVAYESEDKLKALGLPEEFDGDEMLGLYHRWQHEVGERACQTCGGY